MIFISAGHTPEGPNKDPGAVTKFTTEAKETVALRDLICRELDLLGYKYIKDNDSESLSQYLARIKPGNASVVLDIHFNAFNGTATGTECVIKDSPSKHEIAFGSDLANTTSATLGIVNRGVKKESQTARKKLAVMRKEGIVGLIEVCFIDNPSDMEKYRANVVALSRKIAQILVKYENLIS